MKFKGFGGLGFVVVFRFYGWGLGFASYSSGFRLQGFGFKATYV